MRHYQKIHCPRRSGACRSPRRHDLVPLPESHATQTRHRPCFARSCESRSHHDYCRSGSPFRRPLLCAPLRLRSLKTAHVRWWNCALLEALHRHRGRSDTAHQSRTNDHAANRSLQTARWSSATAQRCHRCHERKRWVDTIVLGCC